VTLLEGSFLPIASMGGATVTLSIFSVLGFSVCEA